MSYSSTQNVREEWRFAGPLIGGESVEVVEWLPVMNPAHSADQVGRTALCDESHVDRAVMAAGETFPAWRDLGADGRASYILAGADALAAQLDELAETIACEVGKTLSDARGEMAGAISQLHAFVSLVQELEQNSDLTGQPATGKAVRVRLCHVPVGPVAVIGPWNTPLFLTFNGVAPSLASGCTVVVKPPVEAPLALTAALHVLASYLPPGVLNVVTGRGSRVGQALAEHPGIRAVMFTGGTAAGRAIAAAAAATIKKVALELGGNDAALVLEDVKIDDAFVTEMAAACFSVSGQVCFNVKRIYVHRARHDEFVERFSAAMAGIVVGDPFDPVAHMGPMATPSGFRNALRLLESAHQAGAEVRSLGRRAESARWNDGYYVAPTLVLGLPADHELVVDEQFAPIIPVIAVDSDDEAVYEANRTEFGLASSVWSGDLQHAASVAQRLEAGNTYINAHRLGASVPLVPFGGTKQSGLGRTHGLSSLHQCTEEHAIVAFSDPASQLPGIAPWQSILIDRESLS